MNDSSLTKSKRVIIEDNDETDKENWIKSRKVKKRRPDIKEINHAPNLSNRYNAHNLTSKQIHINETLLGIRVKRIRLCTEKPKKP